MKVSFVNYSKQHAKYPEIEEAILRVARSNDRILRGEVQKFEENLAKFVGTKYAVGCANGTDALTMSLRALGVGKGDEVITVGHTFHATVEAIVHNGATPVLVDVGEDGMMDVFAVEKAITQKTKAIIPVHLMGDMADIWYLRDMCGSKIHLVEDACQALGATRYWDNQLGRRAGATGITGAFSFFPAKILGCYGDGGAVTTNDENLYNELKNMREHYKYSDTPKYGFNSRLDELQAAILNVKFKYLPDMLKRRQEIADIYDKELSKIEVHAYPDDLGFYNPLILPTKRQGRVYQDYIIRTDRRNELAQFLKENGIETLKNDYHFPADLPKPEGTVLLESQTLRLPCNDVLEDEEVLYVIEKIKEFYDKK